MPNTCGRRRRPISRTWGGRISRPGLLLVLLGVLIMHIVTPLAAREMPAATDAEIRLLLTRLELERPGLEAVKAAADDPARAAEALLAYYRARTTVKSLVDRAQRPRLRGRYATPTQLQHAADGVKNIFYSQPSYPPMDFGADIDWFTNRSTTKDKEWLWQLHRMYWWNDLAHAYWHTGDEPYAQAWVRQLRDWVRSCPCDAHSPAWRTIEAGIRGQAWTDYYQHFLDSPAFTARDLVLFMNACWEHAAYLADGRAYTKNNWGLMEAEGTAFIAITFPEFTRAAAWREKATAFLATQILLQVRPDGMQVEQCLGYHGGCIRWFSNTARLARLNGLDAAFPASFWTRLEQMCDVFLKLGLPDGSTTQFGDDHSAIGWQRQLGEWAAFFHREDYRYVASDGTAGTPPQETAFALPDSGFYALRAGWQRDAACLVLKCGPDGGWHCQPDNGTFELYAGGRRLMPDTGTYIYGGTPEQEALRAWHRQTRVHQTLTLDGNNTAYAPRLLRWQPGDTLDTLVVANAGYPELTHRRAILFVRKRAFVIIDEALGAAAGDVDLHFQLLPCTPVVDLASGTFRTAFPHGANVLVQGMAQPGLQLAEEEGWVSYHYAERERRPAYRFRLAKTAAQTGVRFVTLVVPFDGPTPPAAAVRLLDPPAPGAAPLRLEVRVGDWQETVGYTLPAQ